MRGRKSVEVVTLVRLRDGERKGPWSSVATVCKATTPTMIRVLHEHIPSRPEHCTHGRWSNESVGWFSLQSETGSEEGMELAEYPGRGA